MVPNHQVMLPGGVPCSPEVFVPCVRGGGVGCVRACVQLGVWQSTPLQPGQTPSDALLSGSWSDIQYVAAAPYSLRMPPRCARSSELCRAAQLPRRWMSW